MTDTEELDIMDKNEVIENDTINNTEEKTTDLLLNEKTDIVDEIKPIITAQKKDRRAITSKLNAAKARATRLRRKQEKDEQMQSLFGEGEISDESDSDSSDSDGFVYKKSKQNYRKKAKKQENEINELRDMLFKLAKKVKKSNKRRTKPEIEHVQPTAPIVQPAPAINYYVNAPPVKEEVKKPMSFMDQMLKNKIQDA